MHDPTDDIQRLIETWCDRREYAALACVLPAWIGNNGLTDGWEHVHDGLKWAYVTCTNLPKDERDTIKRLYVEIEIALRN